MAVATKVAIAKVIGQNNDDIRGPRSSTRLEQKQRGQNQSRKKSHCLPTHGPLHIPPRSSHNRNGSFQTLQSFPTSDSRICGMRQNVSHSRLLQADDLIHWLAVCCDITLAT